MISARITLPFRFSFISHSPLSLFPRRFGSLLLFFSILILLWQSATPGFELPPLCNFGRLLAAQMPSPPRHSLYTPLFQSRMFWSYVGVSGADFRCAFSPLFVPLEFLFQKILYSVVGPRTPFLKTVLSLSWALLRGDSDSAEFPPEIDDILRTFPGKP